MTAQSLALVALAVLALAAPLLAIWLAMRVHRRDRAIAGIRSRHASMARALAESEARFRGAFEQAAVGMAHSVPGGRWVRVNRRLCDMLGYTEDELLQRTWRDVTHPDDIAQDAAAVGRLLSGAAETFSHRKRYLRRDGSVMWGDLTVSVQRAADGTLQHTIAVIQDVTERVAAEHARAEVEARLRTIVETVPVGLVLAELPSGRIVGGNAYVETLVRHPVLHSPNLDSYDEWVSFHADGTRVQGHEYPLARMALAGEEAPEIEVHYQRGDGTRAWVRIMGRPVRDERGALVGGVVALVDVDRERRAVEALAESEERFRSFAEQAPDVIYVIDLATRRLEYLSPAYETVWGEAREVVMQRPERWEELLHPDDRAATLEVERRYYTSREPIRFDYRIIRPSDGAVRHIRDTAVPVQDAQGRIVRVVGIAHDATERRTAEARLQASEERLSLASAAAEMGVWDVDVQTGRGTIDAGFRALYGLPPGEGSLVHEAWLAMIHPDDRDRMRGAARDAHRVGGDYRQEYRIVRVDTGEVRWIAARGSAVGARPGAPARFVGVCYDITERRLAQERQMLLAREVDHRARNVLAVVQSILRLTRAEDPRRYVQAVEGRVAALARAHTLLSRDRWTGAGLQDVLHEELTAYRGAGRVALHGPAVRLRPDAVQPLSMVLHELATNAAKYGALSIPGGRVEVAWELVPQAGAPSGQPSSPGRLDLRWTERDGPPLLAPPARQGFGSTLISATLRDQLQGESCFDWRPEGLCCAISLPLDLVIPAAPAIAPPAAAPPASDAGVSLRGRRVLLVEDEPLIRLLMEATLARLGCTVIGPAGTLKEAQDLAARESDDLDAAVLDVNLQGEVSYPVAAALAARGVKVIFVTGYDNLPPRHSSQAQVLRKPVDEAALTTALRLALGPMPTPAA